MRGQQDVRAAAADLSKVLDKHLKTRGRNLEDRLGRARRNLPRKLSKQAEALAAAEKRATYRPDLPFADTAPLTRARDEITAHLDSIDHKEMRRQARRRWVTDLVIKFGILGLAITAFYMIGSQK